MANLTVYKASAGSGKTFTLAAEYIKLLIVNPDNYKRILAVTFTNKATAEMKSRILQYLYELSRNYNANNAFVIKVKELLDKDGKKRNDQQIQENAEISLGKILHDYSNFNVTTIDSFFQKVMNNMAKELGLPANLHVDLNDQAIRDRAVDKMLNDMKQGYETYKTVKGFVEEKMNDNKNHNVTNDIKKFAKELTKDEFKNVYQEIKWNSKSWDEYKKSLYQEKEKARTSIVNEGKNGKTIIDKGKFDSYTKKLFDKLSNDEITLEQIEKTQNSKTFSKCLADPNLQDVPEKIYENIKIINSVTLILKHLYSLRLIGKIKENVRTITDEENITLLSDTQDLLSELLTVGDASFIYEKTGTFIDHIMIDEFQDTSKTQWKNFNLLIEEIISYGTALIVGDVKQSIYRWRGGDWKILKGLGYTEFKNETNEVQLNTNYRSQKNIIDFNNRLFRGIVNNEIIPDIKEAYKDVEQEAAKTECQGEIIITTKAKVDNEKTEDTINRTILDRIRYLTDKGVEQNDIAVLTRSNSQIASLADFLEKNRKEYDGISIISNEAYTLGNSIAVKAIISALRYIVKPQDINTKALLVSKYNEINGKETDLLKLKGEKGNEYSNTIPKEITPELLRMSPMDTIEKVYTLMGVHNIKGEDEYLSKFMDTAKDFFSDFHNGIEDFVEKWDDTSDKNNLQDTHIENEDAKGVVAMTIHKSKGLQFKNVIVPLKGLYDRNNSGQKQENLWCSTVNKGNPFDTIPFAAIQTQKSMKDSLFKKEYEENELMKKMDDLNVMYVAFTRAEDNLYLIGESSNVDNEKKAERLILNALTDEFNKDEFNKDKDTEKEIYGPFYIKNDISANRENENKTNPFNPTIKKQPIEFTSNDRDLEIWQSGESKLFVNNKDKRNDFVEIGNIIHALFAKIKTLDDIDNVLDDFKYNGTIISKEDIKKHIEKSIKKNGNIKEWFDKKWTLFNECSIIELDNDGNLVNKRPDRVMYDKDNDKMIVVDYKTGEERKTHIKQVQEYMRLLSDMGYKKIEGFLWYINLNKTLPVKPNNI